MAFIFYFFNSKKEIKTKKITCW